MSRNRNHRFPPDPDPSHFGPDLVGKLAVIVKDVMCSRGYMKVNDQPYPCYCYSKYIDTGTWVRVVGNNKGHGYAVVVDETANQDPHNSGEPFAV